MKRYTEFIELWKHADKDRPEIANAQRFVVSMKRVADCSSRHHPAETTREALIGGPSRPCNQ